MKLPSGETKRRRKDRAAEALGFESEARPELALDSLLKQRAKVQLERSPMYNSASVFDVGWAAVILGEEIRSRAAEQKEEYLRESYRNSWPSEYLVLLSWMYPDAREQLRDYPPVSWFETEPKNPSSYIKRAFDLYVLYTDLRWQAQYLEKLRAGVARWIAELKVKGSLSFIEDALWTVPQVLLVFPELRPTLFKLFEPGLDQVRSKKSEMNSQALVGLAMLTGEVSLKLNKQGVPEVERETTLTKKIELPERPQV